MYTIELGKGGQAHFEEPSISRNHLRISLSHILRLIDVDFLLLLRCLKFILKARTRCSVFFEDNLDSRANNEFRNTRWGSQLEGFFNNLVIVGSGLGEELIIENLAFHIFSIILKCWPFRQKEKAHFAVFAENSNFFISQCNVYAPTDIHVRSSIMNTSLMIM